MLLAALPLRGSLRAYLLWPGVLAFTAYNHGIYTCSIRFGPLFLPWAAVFGMSLYALIGGVAAVDHPAEESGLSSRRATLPTVWVPIITAALFGLLGISEDLPALVSGAQPRTDNDSWKRTPRRLEVPTEAPRRAC